MKIIVSSNTFFDSWYFKVKRSCLGLLILLVAFAILTVVSPNQDAVWIRSLSILLFTGGVGTLYLGIAMLSWTVCEDNAISAIDFPCLVLGMIAGAIGTCPLGIAMTYYNYDVAVFFSNAMPSIMHSLKAGFLHVLGQSDLKDGLPPH